MATLVLSSCGGSTAQPPASGRTLSSTGFISKTVPNTHVGTQLTWFLGAVAHVPLSDQMIDAHFDPSFLSAVSADKLNSGLVQHFATPSGASLVGLLGQDPTTIVAVATFGTGNWQVSISVDGAGLIRGLLLTPYSPPPTSWAQLDRELAAVAPQVSFLAAQVSSNGSCTPIHQVASSRARPLGSQFKLFVLGALAHQIASGRLSWNQRLTVQDAQKSIGSVSGSLQYSPAGTKVSVRETASKMISISDNTAADMLIDLVGRPAVEAQVERWSANPKADEPFLTTRELFLLHYVNFPTLANQYLSLPPRKRDSFLASSVDPLSLTEVQGSSEPRDVNTIEWFASPDDICRAFAGLQHLSDQAGLSQIRSVFSLNSGSLGLNHSQWSSVWFKGGSEPGVLTLGYLAKNSRGQSFVVSVMASNPAAALGSGATADLLAIVRGAFELVGSSRNS
ncbi:MAG TPA: serine hydrolase [Acidimicrobiales bacterium]|nr:serine hydrolase [Acidimicrobiales bacterium]